MKEGFFKTDGISMVEVADNVEESKSPVPMYFDILAKENIPKKTAKGGFCRRLSYDKRGKAVFEYGRYKAS